MTTFIPIKIQIRPLVETVSGWSWCRDIEVVMDVRVASNDQSEPSSIFLKVSLTKSIGAVLHGFAPYPGITMKRLTRSSILHVERIAGEGKHVVCLVSAYL